MQKDFAKIFVQKRKKEAAVVVPQSLFRFFFKTSLTTTTKFDFAFGATQKNLAKKQRKKNCGGRAPITRAIFLEDLRKTQLQSSTPRGWAPRAPKYMFLKLYFVYKMAAFIE